MNFSAMKKLSPTWQKFSNDYKIWLLKINNLQITIYKSASVLGIVGVLKGVLKNFENFTGKHLCRVKCEPKRLIYPCSLHLHCKRDSCIQSFFSEFCRIFKITFLLEYSWANASDFVFDILKWNKYMEVTFLLTVFYRKSKIKQKSQVALKLGNLRFALHWSSSFLKLVLSSC